jgi:hypothetical protein
MALCDECAFDWSTPLLEQIRAIGILPDRVTAVVHGAGEAAYERPAPDTWSPNEYVWHLVDMFNIFAEWLHMTRSLDHPTHVSGDPNAMAAARVYREQPVETGLWALRNAAALLIQQAAIADPERIVMYKGWRDVTAAEVIGFVAHEAAHHLFDLERALGTVNSRANSS